jgi:hypothetical protein
VQHKRHHGGLYRRTAGRDMGAQNEEVRISEDGTTGGRKTVCVV